ncbi:MAG: hypothetical protein EHM37_19495 [Deltaproteobacteria bacterium]|nr:MAG: hypothetical protein EHM37_19495 [Deltaproteobacteria bacterium]
MAIYALGYPRGVPRPWLLAAALVFMLGGVATSRLQHVTQIISYGWLPVLLWLLLAVAAKPNPWRALLLALFTAFWAVNANQVVFLGGIFLGLTAIYTIARSPFWPRLLAVYVLAGFVMLILIIPFYSAMLEIIGLSVRAKFTLADSNASSYPPLVFSTLLFPALYGNLGGQKWSPTDITQDYLYIGIIPLSLFALAHAFGIRWREPLVLIWVAALIFFVLFSMGVNTPLYPFLFNHVPGFDLFRRPADAAFLINFMMALGLLIVGREVARSDGHALAKSSGRVLPRIKYSLGALAFGLPLLSFALGGAAQSKDALAVLYGSYAGLVVRLALFALLLVWLKSRLEKADHTFLVALFTISLYLAVDLGAAGRYKGAFSPRYSKVPHVKSYLDIAHPRGETLDAWLKAQTSPWSRVEVITGFQSRGHSSKVRWHHTQGYNPIHLKNYSGRIGSFVTDWLPRTFPEGSDGPLDMRYDVLGLRYVAFRTRLIDSEQNKSPIQEQARKYRDALAEQGGMPVFSDSGYEVWLRPGTSHWLSIAQSESLNDLSPAPCEVKEFRNVRLELFCEMDSPGTLVLGEVHAPGWLGCVNKKSVEVKPFFDVFRSIDLPAGRSNIVMTYRPVPFLRRPRC